MSPKKVLFLINTLEQGGAERDVISLCEYMDRSRYVPEVWTFRSGGPMEQRLLNTGVAYRDFPRSRSTSVRFALRLAREIARAGVDIIHAFLPTIAVYASLAREIFGCRTPMVYSALSAGNRGWINWLGYGMLIPRAFQRVIANSESVKSWIVAKGVPADMVRVVHNGHAFDRFDRPIDRRAIRERLGLRDEECVLMYHGRFIPTKRVSDLITAFERLRQDQGRPLRLLLAGDGPLAGALKDQVKALGLNGDVVFAGHRDDVPELLQAADIYVFPSELEGLSNSVIEAAAAGLPIVACSIPGVFDIVENQNQALLVEPRQPDGLAEAVGTLLDRPAFAKQLGDAARARTRAEFTIENCLAGLYGVYGELESPSLAVPRNGGAPLRRNRRRSVL